MASNGNGKAAYAIALIIFEVIVMVIIGLMATQTIEAYKDLTCEDKLINEKFSILREVSNDTLHKIDLRLSRIEDKLQISK